jgi:hypothetical protein
VTLPREAWPRLKELFEGARALALDARPAYLAAACGRDEALRQEVETLLASYDRATSFLETPAVLFDDAMSTKSLEGQSPQQAPVARCPAASQRYVIGRL